MSKTLKEKMESWFEPIPQKQEPVQVAASALAMKAAIRKEHWGGHEETREELLASLDCFCSFLYHSHTGLTPGKPSKQMLLEYEFNKRNSITGGDLPYELLGKYNKLASAGKKEFLRRAKNLSTKIDPSFKELKNRAAGTFRTDHHGTTLFVNHVNYHLGRIRGLLKLKNHPLIMDNLIKNTTPQDGPKTSHEIIMCCLAFVVECKQSQITHRRLDSKAPVLDATLVAADNIYAILDDIQNDLPEEKRDAFLQEELKEIFPSLMKTHHVTADHLSGCLHYYLQHNANKMHSSDSAKLYAAHLMFHDAVQQDVLKETGIDDLAISEEEAQELFEHFLSLHQSYIPPSADEVINDVICSVEEHFKGKKQRIPKVIERLETMRASKPDQMDEIVLLHCPESLAIRKMRRSFFKNEKAAFLKDLATNHKKELRLIGLSDEQISGMYKTQTIPEGSGLTIEHIIDREHGGTNHAHNFILMPDAINTRKDDLKNVQTNYRADSEESFWIISWTPKKNSDGTYPKVFIESAPIPQPSSILSEITKFKR